MSRFLSETRERFLLAIAGKVSPARFIELHFFAPIRQGGVESGVAVIAARTEPLSAAPILADVAPRDEPPAPPIVADAPPPDECETKPTVSEDRAAPERYTVYTAKYKLVLKGPDRGKWECTVVAEADAPLVTVETVVRGVQRRSGDAEGPERMNGDEARGFLATPKVPAAQLSDR